jgi:hypothetical protein
MLPRTSTTFTASRRFAKELAGPGSRGLPVAVLARVMHASGSSSQLIHLLRGCVAVSWVMLLFACIAVAAFVLILSKRQSASLTLQVHSIRTHLFLRSMMVKPRTHTKSL